MNSTRNLIIAPVGDYSYHKSWLRGANRNFDLMLIYFGQSKNKFKEDANYYLWTSGKFKYENISDAISSYYKEVAEYERVWLPDEDIYCHANIINSVFNLFKKYNLDLASPALLNGSYFPDKVLKQNKLCRLRYVNFVDSVCPIFTTDALMKVRHTFLLNRSSWGIDYLWPRILMGGKIAVIDSIGVYHKVSFSMSRWKGDNYYQILGSSGISASNDLQKIKDEYGLDLKVVEYSRVEYPFFLKPFLGVWEIASRIRCKVFKLWRRFNDSDKLLEFFKDIEAITATIHKKIIKLVTGRKYSKVRWGNLRRLKPFSEIFGYERGQPIFRYYIENFLEKNRRYIQGAVLEVKDSGYTIRYGGARVAKKDVLDIDKNNSKATIVTDLASAAQLQDDMYDCFILTQVFEFIRELRSAIFQSHRILKPGGIILATMPAMSKVDHVSKGPHGGGYWRFTKESVEEIFSEFFPKKNIEVEVCGNYLIGISCLMGHASHELTKKELDYSDPNFSVLVCVKAIK